MSTELKKTGAASLQDVMSSSQYPSNEALNKGPIAMIECLEEIPCNPCEVACPVGAIKIGELITNLPTLSYEKCIGCGKCIAACPGLAIYVKDYTFSENTVTIAFPFEYFPLPEKDQKVTMVGRHGEDICEGKIIKVINAPSFNCTPVVTAEYPKAFFHEVVNMKRLILKI